MDNLCFLTMFNPLVKVVLPNDDINLNFFLLATSRKVGD